jgi:hypothetical protein
MFSAGIQIVEPVLWIVTREEYWWLVAALREKYHWLVVDKPNQHGDCPRTSY